MIAFAIAFFVVAAEPSAADRARLDAGEVVVSSSPVKGSESPLLVARAVVNAAPEAVWAVVSDCGRYKTTLASIADSAELARDKPTPADGADAVAVTRCRIVADLPFPLSDLTSVTRAVHTVTPGQKWVRAWTLVEGDYTRNEGAWTVEPWGEGKALATYRLHLEPKVMLPASMMADAQKKRLPEVFAALRKSAAAKR